MHLTDDQLNEYLDNETTERAQIEAHLTECADCAARLTALQTLFAEIESLPEVTLSRDFAAPFSRPVSLPAQLPRFLTLTLVLQTVIALITILIAAPFLTRLLPAIELPSLNEALLQLQLQWTAWLDMLSIFRVPALPQLPTLDMPSLMLTLVFVGVSALWVLGNGLLLRKQSR